MSALWQFIRRRPGLRYALTFAAIAAVPFSIYCFPYRENGFSEAWFEVYLGAYARMAGALLGLFESPLSVVGTTISGRYAVQIVKSCDAMEANFLFVAAILAFPAPWRRRALAALGGLLILVGVNVLRICALYFVGLHAPQAFEPLHLEYFPLLLVLLAVVEFILWTNWMQGPINARTT